MLEGHVAHGSDDSAPGEIRETTHPLVLKSTGNPAPEGIRCGFANTSTSLEELIVIDKRALEDAAKGVRTLTGLFAILFAILSLPPAVLAQEEQEDAQEAFQKRQEDVRRRALQRLESTGQQESVEVMRVALEHLRENSLNLRAGTSFSETVKIDPAGIVSRFPWGYSSVSSPSAVPEEIEGVAERLSSALGIGTLSLEEATSCSGSPETCRWSESSYETVEAVVAASVPEIEGATARIYVYRWMFLEGISSLAVELKLERGKEGRWRVAEELRVTVS